MKATSLFSPKTHGLLDYGFALALCTVPELLKLKPKSKLAYKLLAAEVLLYGAFSNHPACLKPLIPMPLHRKIDVANLAGLAMMTGTEHIRKTNKAISFNVCMIVVGLLNVMLTDWSGHDIKR